jgi:hypothetical protein
MIFQPDSCASGRPVTTLIEDGEEYWIVGGDYDYMGLGSRCRVHGDPADPDLWHGENGELVYVVIEGAEEWEASGYVERRHLASTEELVAALAHYRRTYSEGEKIPVIGLSDGLVAACAVLRGNGRAQMTAVANRDLAPDGMVIDKTALRDEFREVCRAIPADGRPLSAAFGAGKMLAGSDDFAMFKAELVEAFGIPMEIEEWIVR